MTTLKSLKIMDITTGKYVATWDGTMEQLEGFNDDEIIDPADYHKAAVKEQK